MASKVFFQIFSLLIFSLSGGIAFADDYEVKIGVVNSQKVIESSSAFQDIQSQLSNRAQIYKESASKKEEDLRKRYKELESKKSVLSKEALNKKTEDLSKEAEDFQKAAYKEKGMFDKAYEQAMFVLEQKILDIVKNKAHDLKLGVVLQKAQTLYSKDEIDLTDKIIEDLNKSLTTVKVDFESAKLKEKDK